jgi:hypothetical protein
MSHRFLLVPELFARWWIQWHDLYPTYFRLPQPLVHFGLVRPQSGAQFIMDRATWLQTPLSQAIYNAWSSIPEPERQFMLFCRSALGVIHDECNQPGHPNVERSVAKAILLYDIPGTLQDLCDLAFEMADYFFPETA